MRKGVIALCMMAFASLLFGEPLNPLFDADFKEKINRLVDSTYVCLKCHSVFLGSKYRYCPKDGCRLLPLDRGEWEGLDEDTVAELKEIRKDFVNLLCLCIEALYLDELCSDLLYCYEDGLEWKDMLECMDLVLDFGLGDSLFMKKLNCWYNNLCTDTSLLFSLGRSCLNFPKGLFRLDDIVFPYVNPSGVLEDVSFKVEGDCAYFEYFLPGIGMVCLRYKIRDGEWICANAVDGEVNNILAPGRHDFVWEYRKELPEIVSLSDVKFEVVVWWPVYTKEGAVLVELGKNEQGFMEYLNLKDGSILVFVPEGKFFMGQDDPVEFIDYDESPMHTVYLDGYLIGKYEVTNKQYKKFCDETGHPYPPDPGFENMPDYFMNYPNYPVVNVSWRDAAAYCKWAGLRLPTEAEWEKASRGTDGRKYPWGDSEPTGKECNYADASIDCAWSDRDVNDGYEYTAPVGSFPQGASPYGCMDMAGNVWERCVREPDNDGMLYGGSCLSRKDFLEGDGEFFYGRLELCGFRVCGKLADDNLAKNMLEECKAWYRSFLEWKRREK